MFELTQGFLDRATETGWQPGGQIVVRHGGRVVLDHAFGEARSGVGMTPEALLQWLSSGKPITAVVVARLHEAGAVKLDEPVTRWVPEFAAGGKESITLRHLLNHTAGLRLADKLSADLPWEEMIRRICETPIEPGWKPGEKAGYSTQASWFMLGEIVRRTTGRPLDEIAREEIFQPIGMHDSRLRLPLAEYRRLSERIGLMHEKVEGAWRPIAMQDAEGFSQMRPGSSARGPAGDLALFYQMLLDGGNAGGRQILKPETIDYFTRRHRAGQYDHTFFHTLDFGLGFMIDSNQYGVETVPYGHGRHASPRAFGHGGAQSSSGFADPEHGLAVAWITNGMPGERAHQERARGLNSAIYEDLGLG